MDTDRWDIVMLTYPANDFKKSIVKRVSNNQNKVLLKVIKPIMKIGIICTHKYIFSEAIIRGSKQWITCNTVKC